MRFNVIEIQIIKEAMIHWNTSIIPACFGHLLNFGMCNLSLLAIEQGRDSCIFQ